MVMDHNNERLPEVFEVRTCEGVIILRTGEIFYIKAVRKFSVIFFEDKSSLIAFHMLSWFDDFLGPPCFCRSHNSYLINCSHVYSVDHTHVLLRNRVSVPVSRKKYDHFRENLRHFRLKAC